MTFQGPSTLAEHTSSDRSLSTRPLHAFPRQVSERHYVPRGTVASRISHLQSLANPSTPHSQPLTTHANGCRDSSRTSFGRRLTNRFGEPAFRNTKPDEESPIDNAHSFLGLNTPRNTHKEEHAMAKDKVFFNRTPGIHGQIKPQGFQRLVQYDAASPWPVLSKNSSRTPKNQPKDNTGRERGVSSPRVGTTMQILAVASTDPNNAHELHRRELAFQRNENVSSLSTTTTSTIRRQSVRDLYLDYGIERPTRLVSSRESPRDVGETRPARSHRCCHKCYSVNNSSSSPCWKCGHQTCAECDALPALLPIGPSQRNTDTPISKVDGGVNSKSPASLPKIKQTKVEVTTQSSSRPGPYPVQTTRVTSRNQISPPGKFPCFDVRIVSTEQDVKKVSLAKELLSDLKNVSILPPSRVSGGGGVRSSPFLIADEALKRSSPPAPSQPQPRAKLDGPISKVQDNNWKCNIWYSSTSTDDGRCASPSCRAAYNGYRPRRHTGSCSQRKRHAHEETDKGSFSDYNHVEELPNASSYKGKKQSIPPEVNEGTATRSTQKTIHECHESHITPNVSIVVGISQHCLDDCSCEACHTRPRHLRCCLYKKHELITHKHDVRDMVQVGADMMMIGALPPQSHIPNQGHHHSAAVPSRKSTALLCTPRISVRGSIASIPSLHNVPVSDKAKDLPKTKASTFIKDASKAPTPPPWSSPLKNINNTAPPRMVDDHVKNLLRTTASRESSAETILDNFIDKQFSTHRTSYQTNITTPQLVSSSPAKNGTNFRVFFNDTQYSRRSTGNSNALVASRPCAQRAKSETSIAPELISAKISALDQSRIATSASALTQRLLEHQNELWRLENQLNGIKPGEEGIRNCQHTDNKCVKPGGNVVKVEKSAQMCAHPSTVHTKRTLKCKPTTTGQRSLVSGYLPNAFSSANNRLGERENDARERSATREGISPTLWSVVSATESDTHECIWRRLFLNENTGGVRRFFNGHGRQDGSMRKGARGGVKGVTVVVHFEGLKDLVLRGGL